MPARAARELRAAGHEADTVRDEKLEGASDDVVLAACDREGRVLVSEDLDFANVVAYPPDQHQGIVRHGLRGHVAAVDRGWDPVGVSKKRRLCVPVLLTMLVGCASAPAEGPPPRAEGGEPAWSRIAREVGVPRLTLEIETDEVARQEALGGKVGFEAAFRAALESLLHDGGHLESPVAIFRNGADRILGEDEAREMARRAIDQPTSRLALVRLTPPGKEDDPDHPHRPQGGEDMREHWVFHLVTKETHDHSHWAVVPRDGRAVFNYGFN